MNHTVEPKLEALALGVQRLCDIVAAALTDSEQFYQYVLHRSETYKDPVDDGTGNLISRKTWSELVRLDKLDTKAVKEMSNVLKELLAILRDLYGLDGPALAHKKALDEARLALASQKKEAASAQIVLENLPPEYAT